MEKTLNIELVEGGSVEFKTHSHNLENGCLKIVTLDKVGKPTLLYMPLHRIAMFTVK